MRLVNKILNHPLFKKSIIYTLTDAFNKAIPFLILPLLTYYLTPAEYGIVSNYNIYISILTIFIGLNTNSALAVNYHRFDKVQIAQYTFNILLICVGLFAITFLAILLAVRYINSSLSITSFFTLLAVFLSLMQSISTINLDLWRMEEKPVQFGLYQIAQTILNVLLTVLLVISLKMGWEGRIYAIAITFLSFGIASLYILASRGVILPKLNIDYIKDALKFGLPLVPHTLGIWIRSGIDRLIITKFYGNESVGLYSTGLQFGLLLSFIVLAFHNAYIPFLYRSLNGNDPQTKVKLVKFTYLYCVLILTGALVLSLVSDFIIRNFLSANYQNAIQYVWWAMFAQAFQGMYLMVGIYIFYAKKTSSLAVSTFIISIAHIVLSYFLIREKGAIGGAYSACIIGVLNFIVVWIASYRVFPMPWFKFRSR